MNNQPEADPRLQDESTRSHIDAADAQTAEWRPGEETTKEAIAESAVGEQLDRYLRGLETGHRLGEPSSPDVEQLRCVVQELRELAHHLEQCQLEGAAAEPVRPTATEAPVLSTDRRVGKYQIVRQLGGGGQAETHLAFDPDLRRHVVLKLYHEALTPQEQEAVLQEGRALARVRSRYVAQVFAADREQGVPYLVVEYIPGRNLAEAQRVKPLSIDQALDAVGQLAEGLAAVHACGLLHRDLKPSNVMLGDDGVPRLVDFGLATHVGGEGLRGISGTLAYMAPEQARGEIDRIDPRSDLFGLGAVLYMLLTGSPPYQAASRQALWEAAKHGDIVPPRQRNSTVPQAVSELCMRCLAKAPGQRFSSARELMEGIRQLRPSSGRHRLRAGLIAAGVVLLATPLVLYAVFGRGSAPQSTIAGTTSLSAARHPDGRELKQDFPINVEIIGGTTDAQGVLNLVEDQMLSFRIEASRDCYVGICTVDQEGTVIWLFPSRNEPDGHFAAGRVRVVPGKGGGNIRAVASTGPEHVYVIASTRPWKPIEGKKVSAGDSEVIAFVTPAEQQAFRDQVRGILEDDPTRSLRLEGAKDEALEAAAVTERIIPFQVKAKQP